MSTSIPKKPQGRPALGKRDPFLVKLSESDGQKVRLISEAEGRTFQAVLEPIISAALAEVDIDALLAEMKGQESLNIAV